MKTTEHNAKPVSAKPGFFATLCSLLHVRGSGAPSLSPRVHRRVVPVSFAVLTIATLFAALTPPALAAGPELKEFEIVEARATLATFHLFALPRMAKEGPIQVKLEYATSKGGPWTLGESVTEKEQGEEKDLQFVEIHHLAPEKHYYARVLAISSSGTTEQVTEFTTTSIGSPVFFVPHNSAAFVISRFACAEMGFFAGQSGEVFCAHNNPSPTSFDVTTQLYANGAADTTYHFEYATSESGPWTVVPGSGGSLTAAEEAKLVEVHLEGLTPETPYYLRGVAENEIALPTSTLASFKTASAHPRPELVAANIGNITATSAHVRGGVNPSGFETHWRLEYSTTSASGPWTAGPEGTIPQAKAAYLEESDGIEADLTGLSANTTYYARLFAESAVAEETSEVAVFRTAGPPLVETFAVHAIHGESFRALGTIDPQSTPTDELQSVTVEGAATGGTFTLSFEGHTTAPIPYNANPKEVQEALRSLPTGAGGASSVEAYGLPGGPYTIQFGGARAGADQPQLTSDASGLTPSGTVTVATIQNGGEGYDTHYDLQYVSQKQFEEHEWAQAADTPEVDLGLGESELDVVVTEFVGADLPADLQAGETYRYRLTATSTAPGNPVVRGAERTLAVPAVAGPEEPCSNEALRVGPSASLPDCRGYEQLTPVDKEGANEFLRPDGGALSNPGVDVGEDGDHAMLAEQFTHWGSVSATGQSPYFFSRGHAGGWQMTAATLQPEAGVAQYKPELLSSDLTSFAFSDAWNTGQNASPNVEFKTGPPGGPYITVASVPRSQVGEIDRSGWVAASGDFSKLVLQLADHKLLGRSTGTTSGSDLYEYSGGQLRQANVSGVAPGATIGTCGARIVFGLAESKDKKGTASTPHAVSADGSRVFFESVPTGHGCSEPKHLYMRVNGVETVDIGEYTFLAADREGSEVLLASPSGEVVLYDTETAAGRVLFSLQSAELEELQISEDFSTIYFSSGRHLTPEAPPSTSRQGAYLYRYDIPTGALRFAVAGFALGGEEEPQISPDGRYVYADGTLPGLPAGGIFDKDPAHNIYYGGRTSQVLLYDSAQNVVECVSCASPFDAEPNWDSNIANDIISAYPHTSSGVPGRTMLSANGDFAFFSTVAALVPRDVDGEVTPLKISHQSSSTDVYEWRRYGVDGCSHVQGCVALISNGRDGYLNVLLGTADDGRDVFFATRSELGPNDNDNAEDIYDARIGGGEPPIPPRPVECEGDACATPFAPLSDLTPSSFTFQGAGNVLGVTPPGNGSRKGEPKKPKQTKKKVKPKQKRKKSRKKARKSNRRAG